MTWIDVLLKEVGGEDILADMMICESPEYFSFIEFNASKKRLIAAKKYKPKRLPDDMQVKLLNVRERRKRYKSDWEPFEKDEDNTICQYWDYLSLNEIALILNRTYSSVNGRAKRLKLPKKKYIRSGKMSKYKELKKIIANRNKIQVA